MESLDKKKHVLEVKIHWNPVGRNGLSPISGHSGHLFPIYKALSNGMLGSVRHFWAFFKNGDHLEPHFFKKKYENIFDHWENTLGIIWSLILVLKDVEKLTFMVKNGNFRSF